jgi:hypothetical protein
MEIALSNIWKKTSWILKSSLFDYYCFILSLNEFTFNLMLHGNELFNISSEFFCYFFLAYHFLSELKTIIYIKLWEPSGWTITFLICKYNHSICTFCTSTTCTSCYLYAVVCVWCGIIYLSWKAQKSKDVFTFFYDF